MGAPLKIFVGHDTRVEAALRVALKSLHARASQPLSVTVLRSDRLASSGLLRRPVDTREGRRYDIHSQANCSTDFSISRFLTPILAQEGWALFVDCDVVFLADVAELFALADNSKALMCVQHRYVPKSSVKMDNQQQLQYSRKNWSSLMLFNCDHPANRRLSLSDVQERPGRDLHRFYWLVDSEIGVLPSEWNWLVGEQAKPDNPKLAHFTLGGPFLEGWPGAEYDEVWLSIS